MPWRRKNSKFRFSATEMLSLKQNWQIITGKIKRKRINGAPDIRRHLGNLGFVEDGDVTVVSENNGNLIVNVKETRVAISREMATRIVVE